MSRRSKLWLAAASLFTLINLAGAPYAAAQGEWLHVGAHVVLVIVGVYFVRRFLPGTRQELVSAQETDERLEHLQQSVDAIAVEVERIGEAQRFMAKLTAKEVDSSPPKSKP